MQSMTRWACASTKSRRRPIAYEQLSSPTEARMADDSIRCDACPVLCYIKPGRTGSCDRYGNRDGQLVRLDPHVMLEQAQSRGESLVPFLGRSQEWDGSILASPVRDAETFVTAIGAGTTYPDYKP